MIGAEETEEEEVTVEDYDNSHVKNPLMCDEYWNKVVILCCWETIFFLLKVILFPVQLYIMIGGPLFAFFIWPLWVLINSLVMGGVFWARDVDTAPCLSTAMSWNWRLMSEEHEEQITRSEVERTVTSRTELSGNQDDEGVCNIRRHAVALILVIWSTVDILLTILSAICCALLVFITFTDADGSVAEGWLSGYIMLITAGVGCLISISFRIAMIIYCVRFRYRNTMRLGYEQYELANNNSIAVPELFTSKLPLSLTMNKVRCCFFGFFTATLLVAFVIGSFAFHDFLRIQYYFPDDVGSSLHGDTSDDRCDPMDPLLCLLPFPSSFYLDTSTTSSTGYIINISDSMLPMLKKGVRYDSSFTRLHDGFPVSGMLFWYLSPQVNEGQFVSHNSINESLNKYNSTTLLINMETLELHPHFTEKDYVDYDEDKLSYIVPAKALHYNTTYVALVQNLLDGEGYLLDPSETLSDYIRKYNNNTTTYYNGGARDKKRFLNYVQTIFPRLESLGINLDNVQLMWDFHTVSQESLLHNLNYVYNLTTSLVKGKIENNEKLYKVSSTLNEDCTNTLYNSRMKKVHYTLNVPWYLESHNRLINPLDSDLIRAQFQDKKNIPFAESAKLLLQIPCSILKGISPATALVEVGHGLFWDRSFAAAGHITEVANQNGWILWSMDWRGLTRHDLPQFLRLLFRDMSETGNSTLSAMTQAMSDRLAGYLILQQLLENDYKIMLQESNFFIDNESSVEYKPSKMSTDFVPEELTYSLNTIAVPHMYFGVSLGAIMGVAWNAYAPIHSRSVLLVGGSLFAFILGRADIFELMKSFTDLQFYSRKDLRLSVQLMQFHLDAFEASGWAHSGRYQSANTPKMLLQVGIGDSTVTDIAGRLMAANLNASILAPTVDPRSVLDPIVAPVKNATSHVYCQVLYEDDAAIIPSTSESGDSTNVHKCMYQRAEISVQYTTFINENRILQPVCEQPEESPNGPCVFQKQIACASGL